MAKQSGEQKKTVERVMHEFKHGKLETPGGRKVKSPGQAIAIGLSEAGASNQQSPKQNKQALSPTKAKERRGGNREQQKEGRTAMDRRRPAERSARGSGDKTHADLYEQAKRRDVQGRSRMSKAELEQALISDRKEA